MRIESYITHNKRIVKIDGILQITKVRIRRQAIANYNDMSQVNELCEEVKVKLHMGVFKRMLV